MVWMELFLAIVLAAVAIATLTVAISFRKRTEKQVSAMLEHDKKDARRGMEKVLAELRKEREQDRAERELVDGLREAAITNNETAASDLRAQLGAALARLDQLSAGLQQVQDFLRPLGAPGREAATPADGRNPAAGGDGPV